jgi:hypothetical protein
MMKAKHVRGIICSAILFLFANQAWAAEDWIPFTPNEYGYLYYNKSSIKKVNKNTVSVWAKLILHDDGKKQLFSILKDKKNAPDSPAKISHATYLYEFDCVNGKIKNPSVIFYGNKNNVLFSDSTNNKWKDVPLPESPINILKTIVCNPDKTFQNIAYLEAIRSAVDEKAKKLPIQKDEGIMVTDMTFRSDNVIIYKLSVDKNELIKLFAKSAKMSFKKFQRYAISKYGSVDKYIYVRMKTIWEETAIREICTDPHTRFIIDEGIKVKYAYYEKQGPLMHEIIIDKNKCNKYKK